MATATIGSTSLPSPSPSPSSSPPSSSSPSSAATMVDGLLRLLKSVRSADPNVQRIVIDEKRVLPARYLTALLDAAGRSKYVRSIKMIRAVAAAADVNNNDSNESNNNNKNETSCGCDSTGLSVSDAVARCITNSVSLETLDLRRNRISSSGATRIATALANSGSRSSPTTHLRRLNLEGNRFDCTGITAICEAISTTNVAHLKLGRNRFEGRGVQAVADLLRHCDCPLVSLDLRGNRLGNTAATMLASALVDQQIVQSLSSASSAAETADARGEDRHDGGSSRGVFLRHLYLPRNDIGNDGVVALARALAVSETGQLLSTDDAASAVAAATSVVAAAMASTTGDDADEEEADDDRVSESAESRRRRRQTIRYRHHHPLRTLDLQRNPAIDDTGASALVDALQVNDTFQKLKIRNTSVSESLKSELLDLLVMNSYGPHLARKTKNAVAAVNAMEEHRRQQTLSLSALLSPLSSSTPAWMMAMDDDDMNNHHNDNDDGHSWRYAYLSDRFSGDSVESMCVICFDRYADCTLLPCLHDNCCMQCSKRLKDCHMCRTPVVKTLQRQQQDQQQQQQQGEEQEEEEDEDDEASKIPPVVRVAAA